MSKNSEKPFHLNPITNPLNQFVVKQEKLDLRQKETLMKIIKSLQNPH